MHGIRPYLLKEMGLPRADASISGDWRRRRIRRSASTWKSELAATETAPAAPPPAHLARTSAEPIVALRGRLGQSRP